MPNRREFLQMSLAASALPTLAAPASGSLRQGGTLIHSVVFESASPLGLAFGGEASRLGLHSHPIQDDVTDLWYHEWAPGWKQAPVVVAGVTLSTSFFCLETLARDHRMRVCFKATHHRRQDGRIEHLVSGPESLVRRTPDLAADWGREFAALVAGLSEVESGRHEKRVAGRWTTEQEPGPMVSWILAPRLRS